MHSILLDQFHRRFSVFSQLCLSNTIVELTVTFWKLSVIKNYELLRVFLGRLDFCTPLSHIAKFELSLFVKFQDNFIHLRDQYIQKVRFFSACLQHPAVVSIFFSLIYINVFSRRLLEGMLLSNTNLGSKFKRPASTFSMKEFKLLNI